jgi:hypothetical protein
MHQQLFCLLGLNSTGVAATELDAGCLPVAMYTMLTDAVRSIVLYSVLRIPAHGPWGPHPAQPVGAHL